MWAGLTGLRTQLGSRATVKATPHTAPESWDHLLLVKESKEPIDRCTKLTPQSRRPHHLKLTPSTLTPIVGQKSELSWFALITPLNDHHVAFEMLKRQLRWLGK
jgi:hypothetical protein